MRIFIITLFIFCKLNSEQLRENFIFEQELRVTSSFSLCQIENIDFGPIDSCNFSPINGLISKSSTVIIKAPSRNGWFVRIADFDCQTLPGENWRLINLQDPKSFVYFNIRADHDAYGRATSLNMIDGITCSDPGGTIIQEQTVLLDTGKNIPNSCVVDIQIYGYILPNQLHNIKDGYYFKYLAMEFWTY